MKTVSAVIVAGGSSARMGFDKLSHRLPDGQTVLEKSVAAFAACPLVQEIVLVVGGCRPLAQQIAARCEKPVRLVPGGSTRAESACNGVGAASGSLVAIHDAARPFVSGPLLRAVIVAAMECGAAAPAVPVKDTIKQASLGDGKAVPPACLVTATPDRNGLYAVQTPQCFDRAAYLEIVQTLGPEQSRLATDDCSLFELAGRPVRLVQGEYANYKITTKEDLKENAMFHVGHGYDVHRLAEGRRLILGGVEVPYEKGLLGHSDADVLTHAVMDALLGAAALGDIGQHFPDTDPTYAGADSLRLLREVKGLVEQAGWRPVNVDATILCQKPKLAPYIPAMRQQLALALALPVEAVSVKATTEEHLGFTGEGLGIAAHAVALLER